jgi:apolipoprotein N-acyltransferase
VGSTAQRVAVAASAAAFYASTGLGELWPLAWVAPIPVLLLAFTTTYRVAAVAAFGAYLVGSLTLFPYLYPLMADERASLAAGVLKTLAAVCLIAGPHALGFTLSTLAARYAVDRTSPWLAVFVFPAAWTSSELLNALTSPNGTLWSLAYSQVDVLPLVQLASLTGLWGIAFVLTLIPAAISIAVYRRAPSALVPAAAILVVVVGYGAWRLSASPDPIRVRVGVTAADRGLPEAAITQDPAVALAAARAYAGRVTHLAAAGAELVVLPEKFVSVTPAYEAAVVQVLGDAARASRVAVVAGLSRTGVEPWRNVALVFSPDGRVTAEYEKHHLVPLAEARFASGDTPGLFSGPGAQWGVAICKDLDFPAWSRAYGDRGVRFLAVPAWDFVRDARLHSRMAVMRGVEHGFTIARAAQEGLVTFSDAYGRILAEESSATEPLLVQRIAAGPGPTFYTRAGDWFGWGNLLLLAALLLTTARRG